MIETYRERKREEARNAAILQNTADTQTLADAVDLNLNEDVDHQLTPAERLSDIEVALCELLDAMA